MWAFWGRRLRKQFKNTATDSISLILMELSLSIVSLGILAKACRDDSIGDTISFHAKGEIMTSASTEYAIDVPDKMLMKE